MALYIACIDTKGVTREAGLTSGKSVRVRCRDQRGREVVLVFSPQAATANRCHVCCEGEGSAELDGMAVQEADLDIGSTLVVGGHQFTLRAATQAMGSGAPPGLPQGIKNPHHFQQPCSHCATPFTAQDCAAAWVDGGFRICLSCLSKGIRPQDLAQWRHSLEVDVDAPTDELTPHAAQGSASSSSEIAPTQAYAQSAKGTSSQPLPGRPVEGRSRRRISASSISSIDAPPTNAAGSGGIIGKVTRVFRRRASDDDHNERDRLQELEDQRHDLLADAGRLSLSRWGGMGLPQDLLARLSRGESVVLGLADCSRPEIEAWRTRQRQLAHLDAEIAAIRQELGLGSDPALPVAQLTLGTEARALENRAFLASDALLTEDLGGLTEYQADQLASALPDAPAAQGSNEETESYAKPSSPDQGPPQPAASDEQAGHAERAAPSHRRPHVRRRRR